MWHSCIAMCHNYYIKQWLNYVYKFSDPRKTTKQPVDLIVVPFKVMIIHIYAIIIPFRHNYYY